MYQMYQAFKAVSLFSFNINIIHIVKRVEETLFYMYIFLACRIPSTCRNSISQALILVIVESDVIRQKPGKLTLIS